MDGTPDLVGVTDDVMAVAVAPRVWTDLADYGFSVYVDEGYTVVVFIERRG